MAKSSYDAALILSLIAGYDPLDNSSMAHYEPVKLIVASNIPRNTPSDYTQFAKNASFEGLRIGVVRKGFFHQDFVGSQEIVDAADAAISRMKSLGAIIRDPADLPTVDKFISGEALGAESILLRMTILCPV